MIDLGPSGCFKSPSNDNSEWNVAIQCDWNASEFNSRWRNSWLCSFRRVFKRTLIGWHYRSIRFDKNILKSIISSSLSTIQFKSSGINRNTSTGYTSAPSKFLFCAPYINKTQILTFFVAKYSWSPSNVVRWKNAKCASATSDWFLSLPLLIGPNFIPISWYIQVQNHLENFSFGLFSSSDTLVRYWSADRWPSESVNFCELECHLSF